MPTKQLSLIGEQGIYQDNDTPGQTADYRYYLNGWFEKHDGIEASRKFAFVKRPGLHSVWLGTAVGNITTGHNIQGIMSSVDRTSIVAYTNNGSNANTTWYIENGLAYSRGTAPAATTNWSYTAPVVFTQLDGISYGAIAGNAPVSSITRSGSTATVTTSSAHGIITGVYITMTGATQTEYNVTAQVTVTGATTFTYAVSGTPATPATGSPTYTVENAYYAATDLNKVALISASGYWIEVTDADFTGLNRCTNLMAMDGYLFVATTNNRIYNSDLNSALSWTSTSFLTSAETPGRIMWLGRIRNYLIAFKDRSIEFYENVGNPTPGSPLEPREQLNINVGVLHRNTIQEVSDGIIFAGVTLTGTTKMYKLMKENLQLKEISNRQIEMNLSMLKVATSATAYSVDSQVAAAFTGESQTFTILGKEFYTINLNDWNTANQKYTQVYDNNLGLWTSWASSIATDGTEDAYGFGGTQAISGSTGIVMHPIFVDNSGDIPRLIAMDPSTTIAYHDEKYDGTNHSYPFGWTSDQLDFGSRKRKFCDSVEIHYSIDSSATPSNAAATSLTLKYRDYDYNTTSGYVVSRTLYYDPGGGVRCIARRLGQFRKRSFTIILNAITAFKIWAVEVTYNQGETDQEG